MGFTPRSALVAVAGVPREALTRTTRLRSSCPHSHDTPTGDFDGEDATEEPEGGRRGGGVNDELGDTEGRLGLLAEVLSCPEPKMEPPFLLEFCQF